MFWVQATLIFIFSVSNDWFSVIWHEARENNKPKKGAIVAVVLGLIAWLSIIWVVNESYWFMVPDLIGNFVGSYLGIKYHHSPLPVAIVKGFLEKPLIKKIFGDNDKHVSTPTNYLSASEAKNRYRRARGGNNTVNGAVYDIMRLVREYCDKDNHIELDPNRVCNGNEEDFLNVKEILETKYKYKVKKKYYRIKKAVDGKTVTEKKLYIEIRWAKDE